jgi:hypothetical protein
MRNRFVWTSVLSAFVFAGLAFAQSGETSSGTMTVTCTLVGSINLTFVTDASGLAVTGTTTNTGTLPFSTVQMYGGSVPANVTKTLHGILSFDLSTPFDVRVDIANSTSATYTLNATLNAADAINTWYVGAINISAGTLFQITNTGAYTTAVPYTFKINVPSNETGAGLTISNSILFAAVSN